MKKKIFIMMAAIAVFQSAHLFSQENEQLIRDYISQNRIREYKNPNLTNFIIDNKDVSSSLKGDVVKIQQIYNGLPIYNSVGTVLIKNNKIVYYTDNFVKNYQGLTSGKVKISAIRALKTIAEDLKNIEISDFSILGFFDRNFNTSRTAKQRLVYVYDSNEQLSLAYEFVLREPESPNYWNILVMADSGKIIAKNNLTLFCNFSDDAYSSGGGHDHSDYKMSSAIGAEDLSNHRFPFLAPDNASYNVFPYPIEAPTFGARSIVTNPWILSSSPEGWHSDGTTHYTTTRGNNVYAYEDTENTDLPGSSADGGVSRNFDFTYATEGDPALYQNAAITNLFYANNRVHDVFYKLGFTESARNFQENNFGKGGLGNDYVLAEAQKGGGLNNALFFTPPDGENGAMVMYLWESSNRYFFYNAPSSAVSRKPNSVDVRFGPALDSVGVTGNIKLSPVLDACTVLPSESLIGNIGLVEMSSCSFDVQTKNIQNAGAIAAIIYTEDSFIDYWTDVDTTITIPSVLIRNEEGEYIKARITSGETVNVTLKNDPATSFTPDGSFDNGIITHEYGHGISNRLTGDGYSCLNSSPYGDNLAYSKEAMGEGWSDFFALMLTNRPEATASGPRGLGTYTLQMPTTGKGIRPAKYSPDFTVNNFTYGKTNGMEYQVPDGTIYTNSHSIGFVWATMLWDLHWQYVAKYGYSSDVTANATNGSSRVLQLVTNALKLQACNPTFIDGRNAILAAEQATTQGEDRCMIWKTFAKRGLGVNANAGSKTNINDQVEDFSIPAECPLLATDEVKSVKSNTISIYPNPAKNEFYINFPSNTMGKVSVEIYDMSGKLVAAEDKISPDAKKAISTDKMINGTYMVQVKGLGFNAVSKVIIKK